MKRRYFTTEDDDGEKRTHVIVFPPDAAPKATVGRCLHPITGECNTRWSLREMQLLKATELTEKEAREILVKGFPEEPTTTVPVEQADLRRLLKAIEEGGATRNADTRELSCVHCGVYRDEFYAESTEPLEHERGCVVLWARALGTKLLGGAK